ncbi:Uncharacterized protein YjbI, contains pentapeptide repeats [Sphingomonas laterariae]|uniref:Uncharacterized protein YjbI, contains pentapeptide repeats n=1 Tax=Edaphosphingomonas laterariae TaxID=861865 RepID=A0A239EUH7_9SPHN|nr:pentapeptide repeat-containing protein [Sphingomonas laterariae]SNS48259.1 Uncharacterized protein YjbI, contains pentapeptide repeats [Sphingomonas laterariae]
MDDLFADRALRNRSLSRDDVAALVGSPQHVVDCELEALDLSGFDLTDWQFERCNLRRADFSKAISEGTHWRSCRGPFASFSGSQLDGAKFTSSDFNNADFRRSSLANATFHGCKLTGADLADARGMDIGFEESLLINAKLNGHVFRGRTLKRVDFSQADLRNCDFRSTIFEECQLRETLVAGARFAGADLRAADLGGLRLSDASTFRGAIISRDQAGQLLAEFGLQVL